MVPYISRTPNFCSPRNPRWQTQKGLKNPHGTFFGMGTKKILLPDTSEIVKMQVKKMYHGGAWEPYLPTRLYAVLYGQIDDH